MNAIDKTVTNEQFSGLKPTASCQYTHSYFSTCVDIGAESHRLLDILGQGSQPFDNPLRRFECDAILDMLHYAQEKTGVKSIGSISGRNFRPATFLNVGYALISANSLRHALSVNARYQRLTQEFGKTALEVGKDSARVMWHPYINDAERMRPVTEAVYAGYVSIGRWLLWHYNEDALIVRFRHSKPSEPDPCAEYFGCEILYDQDFDCLEFKASLADAKLPQANPELLASLEKRLDKALINLDNANSAQSQVYQCIQHFLESGPVNLPDIADALGYSEPTLTRRLKHEGTTFRQVLQEVRQENTAFYIQEGQKSLTEIAQALGYSDQSAFTRAYKAWYGKPPSAKS
ncbi:AraC family transcriptional regulator [Kordiimonas aquimaris]|uniref:AraC family transcriptional regulator n=1 Tax=Kordiimonas aquimaris TaxID=707591 RepID=UPI0021CE819A|nr:AraC family transcriptional regulator [Kordiimonas aquimaris]